MHFIIAKYMLDDKPHHDLEMMQISIVIRGKVDEFAWLENLYISTESEI